MIDQPIDGPARGRAAIDIIAQKDIDRPARWASGDIGIDPGQKFLEQIEAAMNIADRIDPQIRRGQRAAPQYLKSLGVRKRKRHLSTHHCRRVSQGSGIIYWEAPKPPSPKVHLAAAKR